MDNDSQTPDAAPVTPAELTWQANEFVHHSKSTGWYLGLGLVAVLAAILVFLLTRDVISTIVVLLAGGALGYYGARRPRELTYQMDSDGFSIGDRRFSYDQFRSVAPMLEAGHTSTSFMPLKRFAPLVTIYYSPDLEAAVVGLLSNQLPMENREPDGMDRLMSRIRF